MQNENIIEQPSLSESESADNDPSQSLNQAWQSVAEFMDELKAESDPK